MPLCGTAQVLNARLEVAMPRPLDLIVEQYHRALDAVVTGDSARMKELISKRNEVTLTHPLGPLCGAGRMWRRR